MVAWSVVFLAALLAAVLVFVASSIVHMVLKWHAPEHRFLADEEPVRKALRAARVTPGLYVVPACKDPKDAARPEILAKYREGPNAVITIGPNQPPQMGKLLGTWFVYSFVLAVVAGYVGRAALPVGAPFSTVLQVVGTAAFLGFAFQSASDSIWKYKSWGSTFLYMVDGLIYGALTGLAFAWLWPA
jgi:hypothetical protein